MSWDIDLLRVFSSFAVGCLLCQSGSLTQMITQNPLASPTTFGFSSLIVLLILISHSSINFLPYEYSSLIIGLIGIFLVSLFFQNSKKKKDHIYSNQTESKIEKTLLLGLGVNLLVGAIFAIWHFLFMAMNKQFPSQIWFGNFRFVDQVSCLIICSLCFVSFFVLKYMTQKLQLLSLGINFFTGLGENLKSIQKKIIFWVLIITLFVVCLFGVFSFAALVMPLVLKRMGFFRRSVFNELAWGSILSGFIFMTLDIICYNLTFMGAEFPVGMLSSTLGSLVMVLLLICKK